MNIKEKAAEILNHLGFEKESGYGQYLLGYLENQIQEIMEKAVFEYSEQLLNDVKSLQNTIKKNEITGDTTN